MNSDTSSLGWRGGAVGDRDADTVNAYGTDMIICKRYAVGSLRSEFEARREFPAYAHRS
jgi:hypothetical protein